MRREISEEIKTELENIFSNTKKNSYLIHNITNPISSNLSANAILSTGSRPIMAEDFREVKSITEGSNVLAINLGNINELREKAIYISLETATKKSIPILIDPVGICASELRVKILQKMLKIIIPGNSPIVIKANASEMKMLYDVISGNIDFNSNLGVDASKKDKLDIVQKEKFLKYKRLSRNLDAILTITGETDYVISKNFSYAILNGNEKMSRVTATGCILGSVIASYMASSQDIEKCVVLGLLHWGICGELAEKSGAKMGEFIYKMLNFSYEINIEDIIKNTKLVNLDEI